MACYKCGYCCIAYKLDKDTFLQCSHDSRKTDLQVMPKEGPCKYLEIDTKESEKVDYTIQKCSVYEQRFSCCKNLDSSNIKFKIDNEIVNCDSISKESLEKKILEGCPLPFCVVAKKLGEKYFPKIKQKINNKTSKHKDLGGK